MTALFIGYNVRVTGEKILRFIITAKIDNLYVIQGHFIEILG